jgi:hypothetical protein
MCMVEACVQLRSSQVNRDAIYGITICDECKMRICGQRC